MSTHPARLPASRCPSIIQDLDELAREYLRTRYRRVTHSDVARLYGLRPHQWVPYRAGMVPTLPVIERWLAHAHEQGAPRWRVGLIEEDT